MSQNAVAVDVGSLLQTLKFTSSELSGARAAVREPGEARSAAEAAVEDTGTDAASALRRGTAYWLLGWLREAATHLAKAGDSAQVNLVKGRCALEDADPLGAVAAFASLSGSAVSDPELEVEIATARALSGDSDGARAAAGKIGAARKADVLYAEGVALSADGEHGKAKAKFEAAVEADANHSRALFHLAHAHDLAGEDEAAMELYRRATAVEPPHVNALLNLGLLLEDHDRFAEAESLYRRVLVGDPMHERARLYLKDVLAAQTMYFDEDNERKEDRRNQILRTPISEFELSVRSRNCLAKMEIKTLGDLITKSEAELLAYKNFGETSLQEIKDILAQKGLRLGMGVEDGLPLATKEEAEAELDAMFGGGRDEDELDEEDEEAGPTGSDPRALPIEKLELSIRARRAIEALELETVGDLADRTASELMENKNFGQTSLAEVTKKLAALGLALKGGAAPAGDEPPEEEPT